VKHFETNETSHLV